LVEREQIVRLFLTKEFEAEAQKCQTKITALTDANTDLLEMNEFEVNTDSPIQTLKQATVLKDME
jgi:hypothetical protein